MRKIVVRREEIYEMIEEENRDGLWQEWMETGKPSLRRWGLRAIQVMQVGQNAICFMRMGYTRDVVSSMLNNNA